MTLLSKHGSWLVVATMVGIAGVVLYLFARPVSYISTSQVDVEASVVAGTTPITPNMETEAQVATSGVVVVSTARTLGMSPTGLSKALSAKTLGTGNVLSISCTMRTPALAQLCSAAAAASYAAYRNDASGSASEQAHDPWHIRLVTGAPLPNAPAGPGRKILLPIGAFLGFLLGVGGIAVREYYDDRVRDRADLERCLDAPVLAEVPRIRRRAVDPAFVLLDAPLSPSAEAYRYLRARIRPMLSSSHSSAGGGAVCLVAGARAREGRTSVAINLATAIAHADETVILVDADLRHPSLSAGFQASERAGLAELLAGRASLEEVAVPTDVPGLRLIGAGKVPPSAETFEVTRLSRALADIRGAADVVIVDSPPVLTVSDAITLAGVSDLAMVVADLRRTCRGDVRAAGQQIRAAGPEIIVGILNCVPRPFMNASLRGMTQEPAWLAPESSVPAMLASSVPPRGPNGRGALPLTAAQASRRTRPDSNPENHRIFPS
jgi:polysaccharide biosynthesis transport protein